MREGTKALQDFFSDLLANAKTREDELPAKMKVVRSAIAEDREWDLDPPERMTPGDGLRRHANDETILVDEFGRGVSTLSITLVAATRKTIKASVRLSVWRDVSVWVAAIGSGEALEIEQEFAALCSQASQAIQKQIRFAAQDMMKDRGVYVSGPGW